MFLIIYPTMLAPVVISLLWAARKAKKEGVFVVSSIPSVFHEPRRALFEIGRQMDVSRLFFRERLMNDVLTS